MTQKAGFYDNQISAVYDGWCKTIVSLPQREFCGLVWRKERRTTKHIFGAISSLDGYHVPDDTIAKRLYRYECHLIKAIQTTERCPCVHLYLDGFPSTTLSLANIEISFGIWVHAAPVVYVFFQGICTRYGPMPERTDVSAHICFQDPAQMEKFMTF